MILAKDGSVYDRALIDPDRNNFGPRLGFAHTLTPSTVVRGGYGISYVHFSRAGGGDVLPINGPQVINAVVNQTVPSPAFVPGEAGYPEGLADPSRFNPLTANITSLTLSETRDNGSQSLENSNGNNPSPQDFRNMDADFGLSNYHQPYQRHDQLRVGAAVRAQPPLGSRRASPVVDTLIGKLGAGRHQLPSTPASRSPSSTTPARRSWSRASPRTSAAPTTTVRT